MWSNQGGGGFNSYGGGGSSGGGGGFDQQQPGGFVNSPGFGSPQPATDKKRGKSNNIIPCTVAEILRADHDEGRFLTTNGRVEIHQVTLVGLIRRVSEGASRIDYELDDMTGPVLDVKQFVDNDENTPEEERIKPVRENTYVRLYGHVRAFNNKRTVAAFKMIPLTDMNELTMHILEVIQSRLQIIKAQEQQGGQEYNADRSIVQPANQSYGGQQQAYGDQLGGLSYIQKEVQTVIARADSEQGVSIQNICSDLRGVTEKQIREAIDFLSSEGHIYSTIDDEHYKTTDS